MPNMYIFLTKIFLNENNKECVGGGSDSKLNLGRLFEDTTLQQQFGVLYITQMGHA